jgi:hypothetical protein
VATNLGDTRCLRLPKSPELSLATKPSSADYPPEDSPATGRGTALISFGSYCVLGFILCLPRFATLRQSYWHDEIVTVADYVRAGPRGILFGTYLPNNHELFSLLAWATSSLIGESEIVLRLWSVVPFIVAVVLVTTWLHVRMGARTAVLYLFLATASPQLFELSRQARGYGLAFLAMSAMIVAALEADRTGRSLAIGAFCVAGAVGSATLPVYGIAFLATAVVLALRASLRRRMLLGLAVAMPAILAWYAPHADDLLRSSAQMFGERIEWAGILSAPFDRLLLPAFLPTDSGVLSSIPLRAAVTVVGVTLLASSPLLRDRRAAMLLGSGVVATLIVLWATRLYFDARFVSFLLVPLLIFLSSGTAQILFASHDTRRPPVRIVVAVTTLALMATVSATMTTTFVRLPREAHKEAAAVIRERASPTAPVFAYMTRPRDLAFYLRRPVHRPKSSNVASRVCGKTGGVVLVVQPWSLPAVDVPCLQRVGVYHQRFRQYRRGGEINVWFVPPEP